MLEYLHKLRFTDNVMGTNQGLQYDDLLQMMASGKLGMYVGDPSTLTTMHSNYNASYSDLAVGPMPGETATLLGGSGYMFNKNDTAGADRGRHQVPQLRVRDLRHRPVRLPAPGRAGRSRSACPSPTCGTARWPTADNAAEGQVREHPDRELRRLRGRAAER